MWSYLVKISDLTFDLVIIGYQKHGIPSLTDEIWRLEDIGKGGKRHKMLLSKGINTVEDFLRWLNTDPNQLKQVIFICWLFSYINASVIPTRVSYFILNDRIFKGLELERILGKTLSDMPLKPVPDQMWVNRIFQQLLLPRNPLRHVSIFFLLITVFYKLVGI